MEEAEAVVAADVEAVADIEEAVAAVATGVVAMTAAMAVVTVNGNNCSCWFANCSRFLDPRRGIP